ncbi:hypothetical protein A3K82_02120 [Candidatus Pacearchaeota archaeon RBG_19FT_COMBO_34_9]|nr:MAG: hypothetical protein A3K82_02120 [Candidatus Pacearchaeota archaeon RBG_19FT_COMBO_34_9]
MDKGKAYLLKARVKPYEFSNSVLYIDEKGNPTILGGGATGNFFTREEEDSEWIRVERITEKTKIENRGLVFALMDLESKGKLDLKNIDSIIFKSNSP